MKSSNPEERCRRMEFKCRLYDVIKELDRSLKSECGHTAKAIPTAQHRNERSSQLNQVLNTSKNKGSECCCPPGCCKQSLEFRMPRIPPREMYMTDSDLVDSHRQNQEDATQGHTSEHRWHNEDHSRGCRPVTGTGGYQDQGCQQQSQQQNFRFPQSPEEAIQMGCIVARTS